MDTLHFVDVDKGEPNLSYLSFTQIWSSCVNHEERPHRLIIMSVDSFLLKDE